MKITDSRTQMHAAEYSTNHYNSWLKLSYTSLPTKAVIYASQLVNTSYLFPV